MSEKSKFILFMLYATVVVLLIAAFVMAQKKPADTPAAPTIEATE